MPRKAEYKPGRSQTHVVDDAGCWVWQGATISGYPHGSEGRMHRVYYERAKGPIPADHDLHHLCRNPLCVNPDHLEPLHRRSHDLEHMLLGKGRTFSDVLAVRADRARGMTFRAIAAKHGLVYSTVRRWCGSGLEPAWTEFVGDEVVVEISRVCEREDCNERVPGLNRRPDKRFCSPRCRSLTNARKRRAERKAA